MRKRSDWKTALDQLTADYADDNVTIEAIDPITGPQSQAERLPLSYLTYDPKDDMVIVAVGGRTPQYPVVLRHMIWHPTEVDIAIEDVPQPAVRGRRIRRHHHPGHLPPRTGVTMAAGPSRPRPNPQGPGAARPQG